MVSVTVYDKKLEKRVFTTEKEITLMQLLGEHQVFFDANCGGNARCHQCDVLVDGMRTRSCKYRVLHDCKVVLPFSFSEQMNSLLVDEKKKVLEQPNIKGKQQSIEGKQQNIEGKQQNIEGKQQSIEGKQQNIEGNQQNKAIHILNSMDEGNSIIDSKYERKDNLTTSSNNIGQKEFILQNLSGIKFCVDLGTTTIAAAMLDSNNRIIGQKGCANSQRMYGADVASRITVASTDEGIEKLQQLVIRDIQGLILQLEQEWKCGCSDHYVLLESCHSANQMNQANIEVDVNQSHITGAMDMTRNIFVTGNTVMLHILNGFSPKSIGSYPFIPEHKESVTQYMEGLGNVHSYACAGGYIGADVLIGAFYYHFHHSEKPKMLLDLGTNGEMVIGDRNHIFATSVAAGPAFENMMRGSEAIKELRKLRAQGIMDAHGTLVEPYFTNGYSFAQRSFKDAHFTNGYSFAQRSFTDAHFTNGYPFENGIITQDDIRQLQLAKSAVRTGIEILCHRFGCDLTEVERVYVAGGFGFYLDPADAFAIQMFPEEFEGKIEVVGNTSLMGNVKCYSLMDAFSKFCKDVICLDLSTDRTFNEQYVKYMEFLSLS